MDSGVRGVLYRLARRGRFSSLCPAFMKKLFRLIFSFFCLGFLSHGVLAAPTVSNVTFAQRTDGSKLVDVYYDLSGETSPVVFAVSYDGGATYNAVASVTGAVGPGIPAGTGKQIVWNAGVDFASNGSSTVKVRVTALLDGTTLTGFRMRL